MSGKLKQLGIFRLDETVLHYELKLWDDRHILKVTVQLDVIR
jgi:hypothetical protein